VTRGFYVVMAAQALSSLADNALFIAAIALLQELHGPDWMAPMMKWWFCSHLCDFWRLFVGAFADSFPKGRVMFMTNALKIIGCLIMFWYGFFWLIGNGPNLPCGGGFCFGWGGRSCVLASQIRHRH